MFSRCSSIKWLGAFMREGVQIKVNMTGNYCLMNIRNTVELLKFIENADQDI